MSDHNPTDDIEDLVAQINEQIEWEVTDFEFDGGMYDPVTATIEAEWKAPIDRVGDDLSTVIHVVEDLEDEADAGAPVEFVEAELAKRGIESEYIEAGIEKAQRRGDIYEPATGHFRVV